MEIKRTGMTKFLGMGLGLLGLDSIDVPKSRTTIKKRPLNQRQRRKRDRHGPGFTATKRRNKR
jgi:hypothetical protein